MFLFHVKYKTKKRIFCITSVCNHYAARLAGQKVKENSEKSKNKRIF